MLQFARTSEIGILSGWANPLKALGRIDEPSIRPNEACAPTYCLWQSAQPHGFVPPRQTAL